MKGKTARCPGRAANPLGQFIPKGSDDELRILLRELADLSRDALNRARAGGRRYFTLLGMEHVYRDPDTGEHVPASEAPQRAFEDGWELVGYRVVANRRRCENFDRAIRHGARRSRVQRARGIGVTQATGREPRETRNGRRRGSRRGERATSSSSDDPGPSEPEPHSEQPPTRRLCQFCNRDIPPDRSSRARYCSDRHADRDRQRRKRQRDRARAQLPRVPTTADFRRMLELDAETSEKLRQVSVCRCDGSHLELEPGECFRCGHWLPREIVGGAWLVAAFFKRLAREERGRREVLA